MNDKTAKGATIGQIQREAAALRDRAASEGLAFLAYLFGMAHDAASQQSGLPSSNDMLSYYNEGQGPSANEPTRHINANKLHTRA